MMALVGLVLELYRLHNSNWLGSGAEKFYQEMNEPVVPPTN